MKDGHPERRYAAVWSNESNVEEERVVGCTPAEHLDRARKLMKEGYRPVAWSVAQTAPMGRP